MKLNYWFSTLLLASILLISGCAGTIPPPNFSVANVGPSQKKFDAELKSITVTTARPEEATGKLDWAAASLTTLWKESVHEALDKMVIFKDDNPRKLSLSIKILKYDYAMGGLFSQGANVAARYDLIDRVNGDLIYTTDVQSSGSVPLDYAFSGIVRMRESNNRAVQNNILQFLQALEAVNLDKPMFPVAVNQ